ncbi:FAD-binding protein [Roseiconus nitratireducens]|uniref:FAD-binding protein n=1 Tax=Roseiconus nitratireducens TaxID=2605748 RepID=A0A5M6DDI2_9BACT|nr:FAD-binding protein [Roseiconus nitratireducens]
MIHAASVEDFRQALREHESVLTIGNRTKWPLSQASPATCFVSTRDLSGIVQYEPSEFTFTARAGTTVAEISDALAAKDQYLPFDPPLSRAGATLGGTLAAGLSGPGRHRYGGVRDFVLGVEFLTGDGQLIHGGGKVVKNAAGFDLPKFLVGSCGRLAAITELTFKVFPRPVAWQTFQIDCPDHVAAAETIALVARQRWELDAIDYRANQKSVWLRLGGEEDVLQRIGDDILRSIPNQEVQRIDRMQAAEQWQTLGELRFAAAELDCVAKIPLTLESMKRLATWCDERPWMTQLHTSGAGSVGWLAFGSQQASEIDDALRAMELVGLVVIGPEGQPGGRTVPCRLGQWTTSKVEAALKHAMDPVGRFPGMGE